jgi:outer membrane protein OmpA-like peptidoglycan-associated protein
MCATFLVGYSFANEQVEDDLDFADIEMASNVPPTSFWGLRGLSQTVSAEPLGAGRFTLSLFGSYFSQKQDISRSPLKDAGVFTGRAALGWGLNDEIDVFGVVPFYILSEPGRSTEANFGGVMGGIQFAFPLPKTSPVRMALQAMISSGIRTGGDGAWQEGSVTTNLDYWRGGSEDAGWDGQKETNANYAGYDFWEARKRDQIDLVGKFSQTFLFHGDQNKGVKLHLNQGLAVTPGFGDILLLLAAGLQVDAADFLTIGLETNWRTPTSDLSLENPFWLTPTVMYRSPYYSEGFFGWGFVGGVDICLSPAKTVPVRDADGRVLRDAAGNLTGVSTRTIDVKPLESWRVFGDFVFSFDRFSSYRAELEREKRRSAAEMERLRRGVRQTASERDEIARRAREDSLRLAGEMEQQRIADSIRAQAIADSMAALMDDQRERSRQDSIAAAQSTAAMLAEAEQKRIADSLAFAQKLAEERSKRTEQEQMLLSTGMLILADVNFTTGRAELHRNSRPYLEIIGKMLAKYPKLRIEIQGHTDNTGSFETNMRLSQQRAESVKLFMESVEPALTRAQMLTAKGYGPTMPKEDNNTAAGREANRRVELKVLNPEVLKDYNP